MELVAKLRYMGRQYANGQAARGGGQQKHYLEEAADEIERLRAALVATVDVARRWHGDIAWEIYLRHSPEMKPARDCMPSLVPPNASFRGGPEARPTGNDS